MIEIIDLSNVVIDGQPPQDLVTAIANNLQGDLVGILAALKDWDASRTAATDAAAINAIAQANNAELEQLRSQIQKQGAEIATLKTQAAPAICEILSDLEAAGLNEWAGAAITACPNNAVAVQAVVELRSIAAEPPNWSQCDRIKLLFGALIEMSGVVPSPEQAQAMQQILDDGPDSTGPVSAEKLNFHPFMG